MQKVVCRLGSKTVISFLERKLRGGSRGGSKYMEESD